MLASEEDGTIEALQFSLASDIVELVVLTADDIFLQTLREAVGGARRLWHVPASEKVSDLLVAGQVGILVLDVQILREAAAVFIGQIKRQFPDLVVVAAGHRDAEIALAPLISAGIVYRFIHKPMSPGRAKSFADAAVRKFAEQRKRARALPARDTGRRAPLAWSVAGAVGLLAVVISLIWAARTSPPGAAGAQAAAPGSHAAADEAAILSHAAAALAANRLTEPPGDNALDLYRQAAALSPTDPAARGGVAEVHERLLARAESALLEERLDAASVAIDAARRAGAPSGRLTFLTAQLGKLRERVSAAHALRARNELKAGQQRVTPLLELAAQRASDGLLIAPPGDSARFYIQQAIQADGNDDAVREAAGELGLRLLTETRSAIERRDFDRASALLDAARGIASPANIDAAGNLLATARGQAAPDPALGMPN